MELFKHQHKWMPVAASAEERPEGHGFFGSMGGWHASVLQKCVACGALESITVRGRFALADILGVSPADSVAKLLEGPAPKR